MMKLFTWTILTLLATSMCANAASNEYTVEKLVLGKWGKEIGIDEIFLFGEARLPRFDVDDMDRIYLLDHTNGHLRLFDNKGRLLKTVMEGQEILKEANKIFITKDGKVVYFQIVTPGAYGRVFALREIEKGHISLFYLKENRGALLGIACKNQFHFQGGLSDGMFGKIQKRKKSLFGDNAIDSEKNVYGISSDFLEEKGVFYLNKYSWENKELFKIPVKGYDHGKTIGIDASDNVYAVAGRFEYVGGSSGDGRWYEKPDTILKFSKEGQLTAKIDTGRIIRDCTVTCKGKIYCTMRVKISHMETYDDVLAVGRFEIYRFTFK